MILVTGATGHLGNHVVRALRRMGQPVRALVRKGSHYYWLNDTGCNYFFGDLRDTLSLRRACTGAEYMIVCSGVSTETRANNHTTVTVEGHQRLWEAAAERGVKHVVYVSAMGVEREYPVPWYGAKLQAEQSLAESGLNYTILRPAPFTRTFAELARRAVLRGTAWVPGPADNTVAPLALADAALYAIAALDLDAARNRAVEVCGPEEMTARDALDRAMAAAGEGQIRTMPSAAAGIAARFARPLGKRWEHRVRHLATWFSDDFTCDMAGMVAATGIEPTPFDEAIRSDMQEVIALEDPKARDEKVVHRKFDATVYTPGEVTWESLPSGPLRYED
jgi:uncharacterized protein YbjT (DUF2867 family)